MKPVLIYVSKEQCPACELFNRQRIWENLKLAIGDNRATFVKFHINPYQKEEFPEVLTEKEYFYPMVILAAPNSYYRAFTPNDKNNPSCPPGYKIKGFRYASFEGKDGKYVWSGRMPNTESLLDWFNKMAPQIPGIDESSGFNMNDALNGPYPLGGWQTSTKKVRFNLP